MLLQTLACKQSFQIFFQNFILSYLYELVCFLYLHDFKVGKDVSKSIPNVLQNKLNCTSSNNAIKK